MARTSAYPVELVQNFNDAVRLSRPQDSASKAPVPTDLMILRALLAHPLTDAPSKKIDEPQRLH